MHLSPSQDTASVGGLRLLARASGDGGVTILQMGTLQPLQRSTPAQATTQYSGVSQNFTGGGRQSA